MLISVHDRLHYSQFEKDGVTRYATEIIAEDVQFLPRSKAETDRENWARGRLTSLHTAPAAKRLPGIIAWSRDRIEEQKQNKERRCSLKILKHDSTFSRASRTTGPTIFCGRQTAAPKP